MTTSSLSFTAAAAAIVRSSLRCRVRNNRLSHTILQQNKNNMGKMKNAQIHPLNITAQLRSEHPFRSANFVPTTYVMHPWSYIM